MAARAPERGRRRRGRARGRALLGHVPADRHRPRPRRRARRRCSCCAAGAWPVRCSRPRRSPGIVDEAQNGPAHPAPPRAPPPRHRQPDRRAPATPAALEHARGDRPPRRPADGHAVRPDAPAHALRARAARARAVQDAAAAVVDRARRAACDDRWRARHRARAGSHAPGSSIGALGTALVADVWRSETVQGANDNLSGVGHARGARRAARASTRPGLRVLLVSCGAEETLQDGIRAFVARHRDELDPSAPRASSTSTPSARRIWCCSRPRGRCGWRSTPGRGCATCSPTRAERARRSRCTAATARAPRPTA